MFNFVGIPTPNTCGEIWVLAAICYRASEQILMARFNERIEPMTLGDMRELGVRSLGIGTRSWINVDHGKSSS